MNKLLTLFLMTCFGVSQAQNDMKPNILVIRGDDIGTWNISHNNRGMMGYKTPNIDRAYILIAIQGYTFNFLSTLKEFLASQTAGDWSLSKVEKQIPNMTTKSN